MSLPNKKISLFGGSSGPNTDPSSPAERLEKQRRFIPEETWSIIEQYYAKNILSTNVSAGYVFYKSSILESLVRSCFADFDTIFTSNYHKRMEGRIPKGLRYLKGSKRTHPSKIEIDDYEVTKQIGFGSFGVVYLSKNIRNLERAALKVDPEKSFVVWENEVHRIVSHLCYLAIDYDDSVVEDVACLCR